MDKKRGWIFLKMVLNKKLKLSNSFLSGAKIYLNSYYQIEMKFAQSIVLKINLNKDLKKLAFQGP